MSDHEAQPGAGNGADIMSGEQIVGHALDALRSLHGNVTSDQIDTIIIAAIQCGASIIDCGIVATKLPKPVIAAGINRNRFEARWREVQRQYDQTRRAEKREKRSVTRRREMSGHRPTAKLTIFKANLSTYRRRNHGPSRLLGRY